MTGFLFAPVTAADVALVSEQLGRPARGVVGIAARSRRGVPVVVATAPRLPDGTPFPTFYYLCHPVAVAAASRLEADGRMRALNALLAVDVAVAADYAAAHVSYIADRDSVERVSELAGVSAGGMPGRVKCLHALLGHSLAVGAGVNPIGDMVLRETGFSLDSV